MERRFKLLATVVVNSLVLPLGLSSAAWAHWGKTTITDGNGDGIQIQHHLLGNKEVRAQDMLGDGFVYKKGLFGLSKTEGASVLGNGIKIHHGLISGTSIEAQSMFGDKFNSHKIFGIGPRNTTVDVHGVTSVASSIFGHHMHPTSLMPGMNPGMTPGMNSGMAPGLNPGSEPGNTAGMGFNNPGGHLGENTGFRPEQANGMMQNPGAGAIDPNSGLRPGMVDPNAFASPPGQ